MKLARLRPLLALLVVATFGLRTVASEVVRGCGPGTGVAHHAGQAAGEGHDHQRTGHDVDRCECVGHSCSVSIAVPPTRTGLTALVISPGSMQRPPAIAARRVTPRHLLPFAQGPPAPVIA